jgi:hypothetical protein
MSKTPASSETPPNDLAQLKTFLLKLRELREAVTSNKISHYKPIGNQAEFHSAGLAEVRLVYGGNRSGKTTSGALEALAHALGVRPWLSPDHADYTVRLCNGDPIPVPNIGRVVVENFEVNVIQTLHEKVKEWAPKGAIAHIQPNQRGVPSRYDFANGSKIYVLSYEQDDDAFEGPNGHWFWCDEPPPQRKFNGLRRGLLDFDGHGWITMTPLAEPWINEVLASKANEPGSHVRLFNYDIWDNCVENGGTISRRAIEGFLKDLPEAERQAREHGVPLHLAGLVFPEWKPKAPFWIEPFEVPAHWPRVCVIDPHPRKPIAVMWAAMSPDHVWYIYRAMFNNKLRTVRDVAEEMYRAEGYKIIGEKYNPNLDLMVPLVRETAQTEHVALRLIDTSANEPERSNGMTVAEMFGAYGFYCMDAYKRNYNAGLDAIHEALKVDREWEMPGLIVFNTCSPVKQNFMNFVWDRWGNSRQAALKGDKQDPVKYNDDFIDCIRYLFQARLTYNMLRAKWAKPEREVSWEDRAPARAGRYISGGYHPGAAKRPR